MAQSFMPYYNSGFTKRVICRSKVYTSSTWSIQSLSFKLLIRDFRLRARQTEQEEAIQKRLARSKMELDYGSEPGNFDLVIVNDNVDKASKELNDFMAPKVEELNKIKNLVQSKT